MSETHELIDALWKKVIDRRPILGELLHAHGNKILSSYTQHFLGINPAPLLDARKYQLINAVRDLLTLRIGTNKALAVAEQLCTTPLVSTTDHHGPLYHPFWLNANIVSSLPFTTPPHKTSQYLVIFSFSSISLNNESGWPRGIEFHGGARGEGPLIKLPILPDKHKMKVVYRAPGYTAHDLEKTEHILTRHERKGRLARTRREKLTALLDHFFTDPCITNYSDLASQVTVINTMMWPCFFHHSTQNKDPHTENIQPPTLVYLEIESLVTELLLRHHITDTNSSLHKVIFDPLWRNTALQCFNNLAGGFSRERGWGTYFFWGINSHLHRTHLDIDHDALIMRETLTRIPLSPNGIARALQEKIIFPSMLLCYLTIALFYGMKCLGGFCQVHDLTMIKRAWENLLAMLGHKEESRALHSVQTDAFGGDGVILSYLHFNNTLVPATGIDMLLAENDTRFAHFVHLADTITLCEAMTPMLPEMYHVLYPHRERESRFTPLTPTHIISTIGLKEKLSPSPR